MLRSLIRRGIPAAALAFAVVLGAALGFGLRRGSALHTFGVSGAMLLGASRSSAELAGTGAIVVGIVSLAVASALWGVLFAIMAERLRGWTLVLAAVAFTVAVFAVSNAFLPHLLHFDSGHTLTPGEDYLVYALMAAAFAIGTRVAFTGE